MEDDHYCPIDWDMPLHGRSSLLFHRLKNVLTGDDHYWSTDLNMSWMGDMLTTGPLTDTCHGRWSLLSHWLENVLTWVMATTGPLTWTCSDMGGHWDHWSLLSDRLKHVLTFVIITSGPLTEHVLTWEMIATIPYTGIWNDMREMITTIP